MTIKEFSKKPHLLESQQYTIVARSMSGESRNTVNERGTGVPPVNRNQEHATDVRPTIKKRHGAYLPHWTRDVAWYAVTFRLWDSLPQHVIDSWLFERKNIVKTAEQMKRPLSKHEEERLAHLYSEKVERYLDAAFGSCYMRDARVARVVSNALLHFEEQRYNLAAWCVMPNHVHTVVQPFSSITAGTAGPHAGLPEILHSWKSFTAKEANRLLNRSGEFWQAEYYDHLIRDKADFNHSVRYALENPIKAGLRNWKWVGLGKSGTGTLPVIE
ncbi:MAG: menaquinone-specific isochorismate synthase [Blastocatellia bacterium]|jgi:REP element-mobilizing transposase RayT|nr:menaquinone-specific isochorismate synthase [Blastocatellia bacterium]